MIIEFKTEASLWEMMAELNADGRSAKPFDMRRWDLSDDRIYRLAWGKQAKRPTLVAGGPSHPPWIPNESEVFFVNKATGQYIGFEYVGVEFPSWAPGWGFLQLGRCTFRIGDKKPER